MNNKALSIDGYEVMGKDQQHDPFLKAYNYILDNKDLTYTKLLNSNAKDSNIIFVNDLYSKQDYEKIANKYYNTTFKESWVEAIKKTINDFHPENSDYDNDIMILIVELRKASKYGVAPKDAQTFVNKIFYTENKEVRDLEFIESILGILNDDTDNSDKGNINKKLKTITKKEDIEDLAKNFTKEQAQIAMPILQQTING